MDFYLSWVNDAVIVVSRRGDGAQSSFEKFPFGEQTIRLHALQIRLRRRRVLREARAHANRHLHGIAQGVRGGRERSDLDAVFFVERVMSADMVAVYVRAEEPVDVGRLQASDSPFGAI